MTTHATQRGGCDRYVHPESRLCAQKLCGWAPWELRDNEKQEEEEDLAESVRAYERGLALARRCTGLLDQAERRLNEAVPAQRPPAS